MFWSIRSKLNSRHQRQGKAVANFDRTLPPPQSDLAQQIPKDPYTFDFLMLGADVKERILEREASSTHLRQFLLLELEVGFAFVGSQYRLGKWWKRRFQPRSSLLSPETSLLCSCGSEGESI